jgi:serine protease
MDDRKEERRNVERKPRNNLLWLLVLLAVLLVWWFFRPGGVDTAATSTVSWDVATLEAGAYKRDAILVDLIDDLDAAQVAALERELGIDLVPISDHSVDIHFYRAEVDPAEQAAILAALAARPEVELAEPDAKVQLDPSWVEKYRADVPASEGYPNDPLYPHQWHLRQINMPAAWKLADGRGVTVAVLDTGVAYEDRGERFHMVEDLEGVKFVKPYNFINNTPHANDDHGHGTHVTGTIAQATNNGKGVAGVAPQVRIMPLKVLSGRGSCSIGGIADAIRYAADNGADVINMSLGGRFPSKALEKAVRYARDKGVVVVAAAGNDGRNKVGYPAAFPGAMAVAATQYDEATTFYSNFGKEIAIAAPGGNTRVDQDGDGMPDGVLQNTIAIGDPTRSDYYGFMGTSMASPHVAGVAALVMSQGIKNPDTVQAILEQTARAPQGRELDRERYGAGIVDAEAAVLKARALVGGWQLALGLLMAGAVAFSARRRAPLGAGYIAGAVAGSGGIFFLPHLHAGLTSLPGVELLTRGIPSWDLALFGASVHGNPIALSALVPVVLFATLFGVERWRGVLAGVAVGVAGHLLFHAVAPVVDIRGVPGALEALWLGANAAICVGLAKVAIRR